MHLYNRMPDGERTRRENDDLWWMLNEEFCARWVASAGWEWMVLSKLFHGDAFAEIKRRSEEHTSALQSLMRNSDAVFGLKKKNQIKYRVTKMTINITDNVAEVTLR